MRVARARARLVLRRAGAIGDLMLSDDARLSDRLRLALADRLRCLAEATARDLAHYAARLAGEGPGPAMDGVADRLWQAGVLAEPGLVAELIAQLRQQMLAEALATDNAHGDAPSLLVRLIEAPDRIVAGAARGLLAAENRARTILSEGGHVTLPAPLYQWLIWTVAAALRQPGQEALDQALAQAAERLLTAQDEDERPGGVAMRLAAAIDARPDELPGLLIESLSNRQLGLFIALLAHALSMDDAEMRDMVLEPEGDRLWLALRALDQDRQTIARIGLMLGDADPRRDVEGFADSLNAIMAITPDQARRAIAPLLLPSAFRAAIERWEGAVRA
ncbi:hypothetical protein RN629_10745 [Sphingomonadaceae bacterium jetA1]|uniref:hypothetical protein n=1 Tax=Facivitalis istanbulensis TaxID=3075838 RepID=UPI00348F4706